MAKKCLYFFNVNTVKIINRLKSLRNILFIYSSHIFSKDVQIFAQVTEEVNS